MRIRWPRFPPRSLLFVAGTSTVEGRKYRATVRACDPSWLPGQGLPDRQPFQKAENTALARQTRRPRLAAALVLVSLNKGAAASVKGPPSPPSPASRCVFVSRESPPALPPRAAHRARAPSSPAGKPKQRGGAYPDACYRGVPPPKALCCGGPRRQVVYVKVVHLHRHKPRDYEAGPDPLQEAPYKAAPPSPRALAACPARTSLAPPRFVMLQW